MYRQGTHGKSREQVEGEINSDIVKEDMERGPLRPL